MDRSLNQQTYERFRKDIMTFALKPGDPVSAAKLAERYEVSRTPAREALVKLEAEGLVDIFPQSKSVISKIDVSRVKQEWFIRKTLELGMVDAFFDKVTQKDIEMMRKYSRKLVASAALPRTHESSYEYLCNDNAFHAVTYYVAQEYLASNVIATTVSHYNRVRLLIDLDSVNMDRTVSDHDELIALLEKRDRAGYRKVLEKHLGYIESDLDRMKDLFPQFFCDEGSSL